MISSYFIILFQIILSFSLSFISNELIKSIISSYSIIWLTYLEYSRILFPFWLLKICFIIFSSSLFICIGFFKVLIISFRGEFIWLILLSSIFIEIYLRKQIFKIPDSPSLNLIISSSFSSSELLFSFWIKLAFIKLLPSIKFSSKFSNDIFSTKFL